MDEMTGQQSGAVSNGRKNPDFSSLSILIPCFLIISFVMRILHTGSQSLSVDEGVSWLVASRPGAEIIPFMLKCREVHPPLYFLMLHEWMRLGAAEWVMRLSSILCSLLDIIFIYLLAGKLQGKSAATVSAFLMSLSSYHIFYSRELRMYPLLIFLFLFSFYFFFCWLEKNSPLSYAGSLLGALAAFMTHYLAFFIPVIECLYLLLSGKEMRKRLLPWVGGQILALSSFLVLWRNIFLQAGMQDLTLKEAPHWFDAFTGIFFMCSGFTLPEARVPGIPLDFFCLAGAAIIFALMAMIPGKREKMLFPLLYFAAPFAGLFLLSMLTPLRLNELKYFSVVQPALFMLISGILSRSRNRLALPVVLLIYIMVNIYSWSNLIWNVRYEPQNWKLIGGVMNRYAKDGDLMIVHPSMMAAPLYYYYHGRGILLPANGPDDEVAREITGSRGRIWFCTVPFHPYVRRMDMEKWLDARLTPAMNYQTRNEFSSNVLRLIIYVKDLE